MQAHCASYSRKSLPPSSFLQGNKCKVGSNSTPSPVADPLANPWPFNFIFGAKWNTIHTIGQEGMRSIDDRSLHSSG